MRKKTKLDIPPEPSAEPLLQMAKEYHSAAGAVFRFAREAESALYFLYTHTIELGLKAYIRSHGSHISRIHDLRALLKASRDLGLREPAALGNIIELLASENDVHGFRYFAFIPTSRPEIAYLREAVDAFLAELIAEAPKRTAPGTPNPVVIKITVGRPERK